MLVNFAWDAITHKSTVIRKYFFETDVSREKKFFDAFSVSSHAIFQFCRGFYSHYSCFFS